MSYMSYKARFLKCLITNTEQARFTSTQYENFSNTLTGAFYEHVAVVVYAILKILRTFSRILRTFNVFLRTLI